MNPDTPIDEAGAEIAPPRGDADIAAARRLVREYAESLDFSLCFQGFDEEMARFPADYAPPDGALLLAWRRQQAVGVVGVRRLADGVSEMKRLYLRPAGRGLGLGRDLIARSLVAARALGYGSMRLDTIEGRQDAAIALYRAHGFRTIAPYRENPVPGVLYMECNLTDGAAGDRDVR